jgi:hypothetical protein
MKRIKYYLPIIIILALSAYNAVFGQSCPTCTGMVNSDNQKICCTIAQNKTVSINGGSVSVSINSLNVQDNFADTTNQRLNLTNSRLLSSGGNSAANLLQNVSDRNIVSGGIYLGSSTANMLSNLATQNALLYQKQDSILKASQTTNTTTLNTKLVSSSITLTTNVSNTVSTNVTNTVTVAAHNVSVANTATVTGTVTANAGTGTLSVNSQTINTSLSAINTKLGFQWGNFGTSAISYTIITGSDQADFETNLDTWLSANLGTFILGPPQLYISASGTTPFYMLIWYR